MAGDNKLPPPLSGFPHGINDQRKAATMAFGEGLATLDLDALDGALDEAPERPVETPRPVETARPQRPAPQQAAEPNISLSPSGPALALDDRETAGRARLEPVPDSAHPPQNRRMPTQPGLQAPADLQAPAIPRPHADDDENAKTASYPSVTNGQIPLPPPPKIGGPSPSPVPERGGLFSRDRITNLLAGAAIGLLALVFPAKKLAQKYEQEQVVPLITELEGAVDHPLGVQAGLVEKPSSIAARIDDGRGNVRTRFLMIWLLAGLPIGLGLGLIPRD